MEPAMALHMTRSTNIYFPTGEAEKSFIHSIWQLSESDLNQRREIILPKGVVEIIFNYSDKIYYHCPSQKINSPLPEVFVNGINFKPFELTKTGQQRFIGIQLNSMGLKLLFNIPASKISNSVYRGEEVCSDLDILCDKLFHRQSFHQQVHVILEWVRKKIAVSHPPYAIHRANTLLGLGRQQNVSVKNICEQVCLSDRQLRRFSLAWLGMNTEEFLLYQKYLHSLQLLHHSTQTLTQIGLAAGYYDQSHFIREFKCYTDMTPMQYRKSVTELPGHIFL